MFEEKTFIYILKDPITNEAKYVGKSNNPEQRFNEHIKKSKYTITYKNNWINSLKKNGQLPLLEIIDTVDKKNWGEYEKKWILYFREKGCELTNFTDGGDGGNFGEKVNKLISEKLKGRIFTQETIELMRQSAKKRKISDEGRKSLSEKRKGVKNPMFGKKQSIYCIESKHKPLLQFDLNNQLIKEWGCFKDVTEQLMINRNSIRSVCLGLRKTAGGYKWKFK